MRILVKIVQDDNLNRYLMFVKKFTGLGISEIRDKLMNGQEVAAFDSFDEGEKVREFIDGIEKLGGTVKLYEFDGDRTEVLSLDHFNNLIDRNDQIREEQQDFTDMECTKIMASIDQRYVEPKECHHVRQYEGNLAILEFEFNEALKDFIYRVMDHHLAVQLYQLDLEDTQLNEADRVDIEDIARLVSKHL